MGQYHYVVNIDKKQYLHPHKFFDGLKLMEFGSSGSGTMLGLAILLAMDNGRGGGDLHSDSPIVGSWAGDRIVIAGDYGDAWSDPQDLMAVVKKDGPNLYQEAVDGYEDISEQVLAALLDDQWIAVELRGTEANSPLSYRLPLPYQEQQAAKKNFVQS